MRPHAFAAVMATGIVSIAAADHRVDVLSAAMAVVAVVALPVLMFVGARGWRRYGWDVRELDTCIGLLTYVAACEVVAGRFAGHPWVVWVLGALALQGWLTLMPSVLRRLWPARDRARGEWELASVATSGLAVVFVAAGIVFWALVFWVWALLLYAFITPLVLRRVRRDLPPDYWIVMGALAVSTLAGEHVHAALPPGPIADAVRAVNVLTWALATLAIAPLVVMAHRHIGWPTVFPLGMYSAATYALAVETGWPMLGVVSAVFLWIAVAAWSVVALSRFVHVP